MGSLSLYPFTSWVWVSKRVLTGIMGIACLAINISYVGFDLAKYMVEIFKDRVTSEGNEVKVVSKLNFVEY